MRVKKWNEKKTAPKYTDISMNSRRLKIFTYFHVKIEAPPPSPLPSIRAAAATQGLDMAGANTQEEEKLEEPADYDGELPIDAWIIGYCTCRGRRVLTGQMERGGG